jgi:tetratricopeptide (TPR) repeat protein
MKATERQRLKQNDFAASVALVTRTVQEQRTRLVVGTIVAIVVVAGAVGFYLWRKHARDEAGALMAAAMAVSESQIAPAPTVPGATQAPGTYPTPAARQDAAIAAFKKVADTYPSTPDGLSAGLQVAAGLYANGRYTDAEKAYADVAQRAGASSLYGAAARMGLAQAYAAESKYDQAIKEYNDLAAQRDGLLPIDGVLFELARTYAKAGKPSDARATFKRVVDEFPNSVYVAEARQQMTALG